MSARALSWVLERSPLTGVGLMVHVILGDLANDQHENEVWMRQERIAHRARTTRQTVNKVLGEMVTAGLLEVVHTTPFGLTRFRLVLDDERFAARPFVERATPGAVPPPPPRRVASADTSVASADTVRVASADTAVSPLPTQEHQLLTQEGTSTSTPAPKGRPPKVSRSAGPAKFSSEAEALAAAEWERRTVKPVIGYPAFRARIDDALQAGHTAEAVARVLPTMTNFSRNAFDFVLGSATPGRRLRSVPPPPITTDRDTPSGRVTL